MRYRRGLPAKSVARFRCVSKLWASILSRPYFTKSFLTRSSAKPRLLFAIEEDGLWSFFSSPQLQNPHDKSSSTTLVVAAEFHKKLSHDKLRILHDSDLRYFSCGYASGLVYLYGCRYEGTPLICNPITGRYAILPYLHSYRKSYSFFAFEPIDKQYKVLFMAYQGGPGHHRILRLGSGDKRWRQIKCSLRHQVMSQGICINGVLYYLGDTSVSSNQAHGVTSGYVIVCFDVRSEKFTFIEVEGLCRLINYKGKLAVIYWEYLVNDNHSEEDVEDDDLHVWVLEDVEKQEWSKYDYASRDYRLFNQKLSLAGATASDEIVFSMRECTSKQRFYVFYFNPERNSFRRVEIRGFGQGFKKKLCGVCTFVDHVEDLDVNDPKLLESVHTPPVVQGYVPFSDSE